MFDLRPRSPSPLPRRRGGERDSLDYIPQSALRGHVTSPLASSRAGARGAGAWLLSGVLGRARSSERYWPTPRRGRGSGRGSAAMQGGGGGARAGLGARPRCWGPPWARGLQDLSGDGGVRKEELRPGTGQPAPPAATVAGTAPGRLGGARSGAPGSRGGPVPLAARCGARPRSARLGPCGALSPGEASRSPAAGSGHAPSAPLRGRAGSRVLLRALARGRGRSFKVLLVCLSKASRFRDRPGFLSSFCSAWDSLLCFLWLTLSERAS